MEQKNAFAQNLLYIIGECTVYKDKRLSQQKLTKEH